MQALLDIRTLILIATMLLACRAVSVVYIWFVARQFAPAKYWAAGSALMAVGALLIGFRDIIPLLVSVVLGQTLLISGWLLIDAGIVIAAGARPPWRTGIVIGAVGAVMTGWLLLVAPDYALRTVFNSLPGILFDSYAAFACLRARKSRIKASLILLAVLLALVAASNTLKAWFVYSNDIQALFYPAWQIAQFYLVSLVSILVSAAIFALLAAQSLQEQLDQELEERTRINNDLSAALLRAERFRSALDKVPAYVFMKDLDSRYTYANQPTLELFKCTAGDLVGSSDSRFFPPEAVEQLLQIDKRVFAGESTREEVRVKDESGRDRIYLEVKSPVFSDLDNTALDGLCGISTDISTLKEHERHLEFVAHYDSLTKLPNRILLSDRLGQALAQAKRRHKNVAVAFLDLDGFKQVNDTHGHDVGDALLVALAKRMGDALRQGDTLARLGGDEFVAVIVDLAADTDCDPVIERLLRAAADPLVINGSSVQVSASIGITVYPEDDSDPDLLMRHADQAMYRAKKSGKNCFRKYGLESDLSRPSTAF
jgi:diguanylate cyclase (GGDEF)-like protein/PAS domain S-box-containing protein